MIKNYTLFLLVLFVGIQSLIFSQEPKIFIRADFDLQGDVKTCLVITDYGKEEFEFNQNGWLTKSVTRYNENDYDITYYRYKDGELSEKRNEKYRDGVFDESTSIAHVEQGDTTANKKITEKVFSYTKEVLDQYEYQYDAEGTLAKIIRSGDGSLDETTIEQTAYKNENTVSYYLNGVIQKSVRTSKKKTKNGSEQKVVLTKEFLEGEPNKANEEIYEASGKLISQQLFEYKTEEKTFAPSTHIKFQYDDRGMLSSIITKTGDFEEKKEYIYQFDDGEEGNWIKQIITPDNAYTTRKITYYAPEQAEEEKE